MQALYNPPNPAQQRLKLPAKNDRITQQNCIVISCGTSSIGKSGLKWGLISVQHPGIDP